MDRAVLATMAWHAQVRHVHADSALHADMARSATPKLALMRLSCPDPFPLAKKATSDEN
jgi:hypothetical protein